MTTYGATSDDKIVKMTIFCFQCIIGTADGFLPDSTKKNNFGMTPPPKKKNFTFVQEPMSQFLYIQFAYKNLFSKCSL